MMRYPSFDEHMPIGRGRWLTYYCHECREGRGGFLIRENPATMIDPPWLESDTCPYCGADMHDAPLERETEMTDSEEARVAELVWTMTDRPIQIVLDDGATVLIEPGLVEGKYRAAAWFGNDSVARLHEDAMRAASRAVRDLREML